MPGSEPCAIEYRTFALTRRIAEAVNASGLREHLQDVLGMPIGHALILGRPHHGVVVVTVESSTADRVIDALVHELKRVATNQLTGTRPGLVCVKFLDITEQELLDLAESDNAGEASSLQQATSLLLDRADWHHVHTIAYSVPGNRLSQTTRGGSPSYFFRNPHNELASGSRIEIF
jgi:hypothetical protein